MNYHELTKIAKKIGWYELRKGKGSHIIWTNDINKEILPIPNHGTKEIKPNFCKGLLKKIKEIEN